MAKGLRGTEGTLVALVGACIGAWLGSPATVLLAIVIGGLTEGILEVYCARSIRGDA